MDGSPDKNSKTHSAAASLDSSSHGALDAFHVESQKLQQGAKRMGAALYEGGAFMLGTEIEPKLAKASKELKEELSGGAVISVVGMVNRVHDATVAFAERELAQCGQSAASELLTANLHSSCNNPRVALDALNHEVNSLDPVELQQAVAEMNLQSALTHKAYGAQIDTGLFSGPEVVFLEDCPPEQKLYIPYKLPVASPKRSPASLNFGNFSIRFFD
jgi:hypothetical protein